LSLHRFKATIREELCHLFSKVMLERTPCPKHLIVAEYALEVCMRELHHDGIKILLHEAHAHGDPALEGLGEEKCSNRFVAPGELLIPRRELFFKILLRVFPLPERINVHEVEKETAGELAAVDPDGFGVPVTLNRVRLFLHVGEEEVPLPAEPVFFPAGLVVDDDVLTEGAFHLSIVA
jgi:hypothetical protein